MPKKILILSANPKTTPYLRLDEELREIQSGLERARRRDEFQLVARWAVRPRDLRRALLDFEPEIVHFSGHGEGDNGLSLENDAGEVQPVSSQALARLFKLFNGKTHCVLLNACYSAQQAEQLRGYSDYVIGMAQAVGDAAALRFAIGFYDALGAGRDYADAFEFGRAAIDLEGLPETAAPVLLTRTLPAETAAGEPGEESLPEAPEQTQWRELAEKLTREFQAVMDSSRLAGQVKPRDEFTRHPSDSLRLIREAVGQLQNLPARAEYNHVRIMAGSVLSSSGDSAAAEQLFQQALDKAESAYECALANFNLFQVRLRRKAWDEALVDLDAAIRIDPRRYALHDHERYPIERILGAGGMGCVFLCRHRLRRKLVVVKCFWESKPGSPEKVFHEAFLMRDLAGQYVPEPLDYGYVDPIKQQRAFFVSEYIADAVDGEAWLARHGKLSLAQGLEVARQLAQGLLAAHQAGIYHHDLKPANLLIKIFSARGEDEPQPNSERAEKILIKIIDFGLARVGESLADPKLGEVAGLSRLGQDIFGTFDYAPPEQQGLKDFGEPGAKSDVFSFGATLYRLLTHENPRLPRERALPESGKLRELILDCLEHAQEKRPALDEVVERLGEISAERETETSRKAEKENPSPVARGYVPAREHNPALPGYTHLRQSSRQAKSLIVLVLLLAMGAGVYFSGVFTSPVEVPAEPIVSVPPEETPQEKAEREAAAKAEQERLAQQEAERKAAEEKAKQEAAVKAEQEHLAQQEAERKAAAEEKAKREAAAKQQQLDELLARCREHFAADRLTTGSGGTALECYNQVLVEDPGNEQAAAGKRAILEQYAEWSKNALSRGQWDKVETYLERMVLVDETSGIVKESRAALANAYFQHALVAVRDGDWDAAENSLHRLAALDEKDMRLAGLWKAVRKGREVEEARREEEALKRRLAEEEAQRKVEEEARKRRLAEEEAQRKAEEERTRVAAGSIWTEPVTGIVFVKIPGGCFYMGSNNGYNDEKPVHRVCVDAFWLGQTEVTQAQWQKIMGNNPSYFKGNNRPVENVSWNDVQVFVRKTGCRLPTEAEWEYAARAGSTGDYSRAADGREVTERNLREFAWYRDNSENKTHPVGKKKPNAFDLYDMHGNVWEWGQDRFGAYSTVTQGKRRIIRGGAWRSFVRDVRAAGRNENDPGGRNNWLGFRCARI